MPCPPRPSLRRAPARHPRGLGITLALAFALLPDSRANPSPIPAPDSLRLTLPEARQRALLHHPRITAADLRALAAHQVALQARAALLPNLSANAVAVGTASDNVRIGASGGLNNPTVFERNAEGIALSQLITDFGRTANFTRGAQLLAAAESDQAAATREQILLAVDSAFFTALQTRAVVRVANQTLTARQAVLDQTQVMATNQLRSELEVSFARVNLEEGRLLVSKSQNDQAAALAQLTTLLGEHEIPTLELDEVPLVPATRTNVADLVHLALANRPDLLAARHRHEAALHVARAEQTWRRPSLSALGTLGVIPLHDDPLPDTYAAAGLVLNIPLYAGGAYAARRREANLRADAADALLRDAENLAIRDVRLAWLKTSNAFDRYRITDELLAHARQSYSLAESRYRNGLSSVVELNQAELSLLSAEISHTTTQYEYLICRSALDFETGSLH